MTREEAIIVLEDLPIGGNDCYFSEHPLDDYAIAINMAIDALKQLPEQEED